MFVLNLCPKMLKAKSKHNSHYDYLEIGHRTDTEIIYPINFYGKASLSVIKKWVAVHQKLKQYHHISLKDNKIKFFYSPFFTLKKKHGSKLYLFS